MNSRYLALLITALLPLSTQAAIETWTGPDGRPVQAEFIRRSGDYISFQKPSGASYLLPYSKLSEADRARVDALTGETWTGPDGRPIQAEFIRRSGDYISFQKPSGASYRLPYSKLSEADRARVDALTGRTASASATGASSTKPSDDSAEPAATNKIGKVIAPLIGKLVHLKGSALVVVPQTPLTGVRYVAFYYSAHWCPPCRAFTPKLVTAYKEIKAAHPEFEVIFVSSDQDEDSMKTYMRETSMAWPTVRFGQKDNLRSLQRPGHERGIPNLVFMTADGKELATSYTPSGDYSGPNQVLAAIQKHFKK